MKNRAFMIGAAGASATVVMLMMMMPACGGGGPLRDPASPAPPGEPPVNTPPRPAPDVQGTYIGTLRGGMAAIGGETTGWELQGPGDGRGGGMMVDVSGVREAAQRLEGQRVVIRGRVETRRYVERGEVPVLIAESINPREE